MQCLMRMTRCGWSLLSSLNKHKNRRMPKATKHVIKGSRLKKRPFPAGRSEGLNIDDECSSHQTRVGNAARNVLYTTCRPRSVYTYINA